MYRYKTKIDFDVTFWHLCYFFYHRLVLAKIISVSTLWSLSVPINSFASSFGVKIFFPVFYDTLERPNEVDYINHLDLFIFQQMHANHTSYLNRIGKHFIKTTQ